MDLCSDPTWSILHSYGSMTRYGHVEILKAKDLIFRFREDGADAIMKKYLCFK